MPKQQRLIARYENIDNTHLVDVMRMFAAAMEDSLIQAGARPGEDYTMLDCFRLAQPFVLEQWQKKQLLVDLN